MKRGNKKEKKKKKSQSQEIRTRGRPFITSDVGRGTDENGFRHAGSQVAGHPTPKALLPVWTAEVSFGLIYYRRQRGIAGVSSDVPKTGSSYRTHKDPSLWKVLIWPERRANTYADGSLFSVHLRRANKKLLQVCSDDIM